ncbi:MAG: hypothetical protein PHQ19_09950, partial [Candidatus Krumholzibacteria bacterium]|nr:hypothetical protein [Candidatus Krumholzibacteria bacterium]
MVKRILKAKQTHWISLGIGLILTVFIVALLVFRTDFFALHSSRILTRYIFAGTDFTLDIGQLSGNPLKEIAVRDFRIRYNGGDYSFDVIRIELVRVAFRPRMLLSSSPRIDEIALMRPHVWIKPDTSGASIIPRRAGGRGSGRYPEIAVERFSLADGQLIYQGKSAADAFRRLFLEGSLASDGAGIVARLERGGAEDLRRGIVLRALSGEVRYSGVSTDDAPAGTIGMDRLRAALDQSVLTLTGAVDPGSLSMDLSIEAEPIDVVEVARLLGVETGHSGELQGLIGLRGVPDSMSVSAVLTGVLSGYALDEFSLEGLYRPGIFTADRASGGFNGAAVTGSGSYRFGGDPVLSIDVETSGLDLSAGFIDSENIPATNLSGKVRMTYLPAAPAIVFDFDLGPGHIRRFPFDAAAVSGAWNPDSLEFSRILIVDRTHSINSNGVIRDDSLRFYIDLAAARSDTIFEYLHIGQYRADLDMNGIIEGTFDDWELRGSGGFGAFSYHGTLVPEGDLKLAVRYDDGYEAYIELAGDSCVIEPASFSGIDLSLEYVGGLVSIKHLRLDRAGFAAEMRGEIRADQGRSEIAVAEFEVTALEEVWRSAGDFGITIADDTIVFEDLQMHSRLGALYLDATVDRTVRTIDADLTFDRLGLALLNSAGLLEGPIEGRMRGTVSCAGTLEDPDLAIELGVSGIAWDTLAVDTVFFAARYSNSLVTVDTFSASSSLGGVDAHARFEGSRIRDLLRGGAAISSLSVDAEASCRDLSLAPFLRYSSRIPFDRGAFTGRIEVSDSLSHPVATMEGAVAGLGRDGLSIPLFRFRSDLAGLSVELHGEVELSERHRGSFSGRLPLRREPWFYSVDDGGRLFLELIMPPGELDELPAVTDLVAAARGRYAATVSIEGTVAQPAILGELTLSGAEFRLSGMEERFSSVDA